MIDENKLIEDCKKYLEDTYTFQTPLEYSVAMTRLLKIIEAQPKLSLETKTSDNRKLIDADDLLKALDELSHSLQGARYYFAHIENWIRSQPKLDVPNTNVGKWIPVTERLPEVNVKVLVTYEKLNGCYLQIGFDKRINCKVERWQGKGTRIVAWMPLPEAYKG